MVGREVVVETAVPVPTWPRYLCTAPVPCNLRVIVHDVKRDARGGQEGQGRLRTSDGFKKPSHRPTMRPVRWGSLIGWRSGIDTWATRGSFPTIDSSNNIQGRTHIHCSVSITKRHTDQHIHPSELIENLVHAIGGSSFKVVSTSFNDLTLASSAAAAILPLSAEGGTILAHWAENSCARTRSSLSKFLFSWR